MLRKVSAIVACMALASLVRADQPQYADDEITNGGGAPTFSTPAPNPVDPGMSADCVCSVFAQDGGGTPCIQSDCTHAAAACEQDPNGGARWCNGGLDPNGDNGVLFNNGADNVFVLGGVGFDGEDASAYEAPNCTWGNNTLVTAFHQADDFTVPDGETWDIAQGITWIYQTNSTREQLITEIYIQIWDGVPGDGGAVIAGDMVTNRLAMTSQYSHANRVAPTDLLNVACVLKTVTFDMSWLDPLEAGTYWIEFATRGQAASGPWMPTSAPYDPDTDNSRYFEVATNGWFPNSDGCSALPSDRPFVLVGTGGSSGTSCQYALKKNSKAKKGCDVCPQKGDLYSDGSACEDVKDCGKKISVKQIDCPDGGDGFCKKIKGKREECS